MKFPNLLWLLLIAIIPFHSCKKGFTPGNQTSEEIGRYISAHVPGVIGINDPVRIRFSVPVDTSKTEGVFVFQPSAGGRLNWEDASTLAFTPENGWTPGGQYQMQVSLDKLIKDVDPKMRSIVFSFMVKPLQLLVDFDPLVPEFVNDQPEYLLRGRFWTSISVDSQKIEKLVALKSSGKMASPKWHHSEDGMTHEVVIQGIAPDSKLDITWNGKSIGAINNGTKSVAIPRADQLTVLSFEPGADDEKKIGIYFSQKLDPNQDITGLVTINESTEGFRVKRQDHVLTIYPGEDLEGDLHIELHPSLSSLQKHALGETVSMDVSLEDENPGLRLSGSGVITPGNEAVIFPFEAINLRAVRVEVVRIFENNILQFLQNNDLEDEWGLEPVGRIILQKQVELSSLSGKDNQYVWTRYALDLGPLVQLAPGSIYQVRLCFLGEDTYLGCVKDIPLNEGEHTLGEIETLWKYHYYYEGFTWEQSGDPCYPAYYNPEHFVSRNILASDIGLTAKQNEEGKVWVIASSIQTSAPSSGVSIEVFDYQQQSMGKASTSSDGVAMFTVPRKAFFVVATQGNQKGYLRLADGLALSVSEFNVGGTGYQQGLRGYIYADRDVWRPGDSVFLNFVLWDPEGKVDSRHPVTLSVTNPLGQKMLEKTSPVSVGGIYDLAFATGGTDPTGNWMARVKVGDAEFSKSLRIETIKPNRLKINVDLPEAVFASDKDTKLNLESQWLFGAPAANLKAVVEAQFTEGHFAPEGFKDFEFTDPARKTPASVLTLFDGTLDAQGKAKVDIPDLTEYLPEGVLNMSVKTRVFESGGDFSTDRFSTTFHPYDFYSGVSIPKNRWGYQEMQIHVPNEVRFATVSAKGKAAGNRTLSVGIYHANWRWWWDRSDDDITKYNSEMHLGAIETDTIQTGANGIATYKITPPSWGSYMVRVCDTESGHCSGEFYYAGSWGDPTDDSDAASRLYFTTDKEKYAVGDQIKLNIPSVPGARILLTIEKNNQVLSTKWYPVTSEQTQITIEATPDMMPNAYACVTHLQPFANGQNDMPIRMYGIMPLMVEDPKTRLYPEIAVQDVLAPDKDFTITVSEKDKQAMAYTIAVVDEGLLGLTRFESPDPWKHFHRQEALAMQTWDMYDDVLGGYGGTIERLLSLGGDEAAKLVDAPQARRFRPVVMHLGPFYLEPGQKVTHTLHMPNYVGAVRTMIVASDRKRWGSADKTSQVKSDMMLQATLPRLVSPGETITVPVQVFAMSDAVKNVDLSIKATEVSNSPASQKLTFSQQGDKMAYFELKVAENPGLMKVDVQATSGSISTKQSFELDIRIPNPIETRVVAAMVEPGKTWNGTVPLPGMKGTNEAYIEVSQMPSINLQQRLQYLIRYPYGCLEQTTSSVFPQLYLSALTDLTKDQEVVIRKNIRDGIERLKKFALASGGFTYWPGENYRDSWTNSYAGHFLFEAKRAGYAVDQGILDGWLKAQKKDAQAYRPGQYYRDDLNQAYRLYTLALSGDPAWGLMNRLRVQKDLDITTTWMLAAAYAQGKRNDVANALIANASKNIKPYQELAYTYGSELRDKAIILDAFLAMGKMNDAMEMARSVASTLSSDDWYGTQSTAYALLSLGKMAKQFSTGTMKAKVVQQGGAQYDLSSEKGILTRSLEVSSDKVSVTNTSAGPLFIRVTGSGRPLHGITAEVKKNLALKVKYTDMEGKEISPDRMSQGKDFVVELVVTNPGTFTNELDQMALSYLFPSGWEITNQRFDGFDDRFKNSAVRYIDYRDDRVNLFFNMSRGTWTYHFVMTATYAGHYWLPDIMCEAMYSHQVQARMPGRWVDVLPAGAKDEVQ